MDLLLGYLAGLLTLINPCVLPVLPIVLATALQGGRFGPVWLAAGMSVSFVVLGLLVAAAGRSLGLTEESVARGAALAMVVFGAALLVPGVGARFASATSGLSAGADARMDGIAQTGPGGQLLGGALLGAVWSPCIGPTLGGAIALASQGESLWRAGAIMVAFAAGVSTLILVIAYLAQNVLRRRRALFQRASQVAQPMLGAVFVLVGLAIFFGLHKTIDAWVLDTLPYWLTDLSVSI